MAKAKVNGYIDMDLAWLEKQADEIKEYCDNNKISELKDRKVGNRITATIEQQITSKRQSLQDYIKIVEAIDRLREKEAVKKTVVRGDQELSPLESGGL